MALPATLLCLKTSFSENTVVKSTRRLKVSLGALVYSLGFEHACRMIAEWSAD